MASFDAIALAAGIPEDVRGTAPAARMYCLMFSCRFYDALVLAVAPLASACLMPNTHGKAPKWMEYAAAPGRLLFDPTLRPEPPPELSELGSFGALVS